MLTARRDPSFHPDALDRSRPTHEIDLMARHPAPSHSRFMTALQMIGSVLAIPLGLASGYSIYHSNFSTEAQCQSLRASIVSMLDKSADASTLRMLVRRDVATFETTCGSVDPEAVAAFKNLLASGTPAAPPRPVAPAKQVTREPVRPPQEAAKPAPAKAVEAKPVQRDAAVSDAKWVASVRDALIHAPEPQSDADAAADTAEAPAAAPAAVPSIAPIRAPSAAQAPALSPAPPPAAPALPPAASIAAAPVPASPVDHPVPPAAIPDPAPMPAAAAEIQKPAPSGIRGAIAEIPLLGRLVK
jgi:hypothetical protein